MCVDVKSLAHAGSAYLRPLGPQSTSQEATTYERRALAWEPKPLGPRKPLRTCQQISRLRAQRPKRGRRCLQSQIYGEKIKVKRCDAHRPGREKGLGVSERRWPPGARGQFPGRPPRALSVPPTLHSGNSTLPGRPLAGGPPPRSGLQRLGTPLPGSPGACAPGRATPKSPGPGGAGRGGGQGRGEWRGGLPPAFRTAPRRRLLLQGGGGEGLQSAPPPRAQTRQDLGPTHCSPRAGAPCSPEARRDPAPVLKRGFGSPGSPGSGGRGEVLIPDSLRPARSPLALSFHPPQGPERARGPHPARTAALRTNAGTGVAGEQREGAVQVPSCSMCARPRPPTHRTRTGATGAARLSRSFLSGSGDGAGVRRPPLPCRRVAPSRALG